MNSPEETQPELPGPSSTLAERQPYFDWIAKNETPISIRKLIGIWGKQSRGIHVNNSITSDLEEMGFVAKPPIEIGPIDSHVLINKIENINKFEKSENSFSRAEIDNHLLTLAAIPSATLNQQENEKLLCVDINDGVNETLAKMLISDFSQVPVVEKDKLVGVFSWESFGQSVLAGRKAEFVREAVNTARPVELRTDLLQTTDQIAKDGFVLVVQFGKLVGLVTASDLTSQFAELTAPFLAIGRVETELKRVAKLMWGELKEPDKNGDRKRIDSLMMMELLNLYASKWDDLQWEFPKCLFLEWGDRVRILRNSIAHYDEQDEMIHQDLELANRLTGWLQQFN